MEAVGVAELGEAVNHRAAGIAQAQHFGALVEGFAHRVVDRLAQDFVLERAVDLDNLRVAAGNQQAQVGEGGLVHGFVRLPDEIRQDMALQMVHHHHGDIQRQGQRLGEGGAHQEGAQQARAAGEGDGGQVRRRDARLPQRLGDDRDDVLLVGAGRQFRLRSAGVTPAFRSASETTGTMFCSWAREASSGTTPPKSLWTCCEAMTFDNRTPSRRTAAEVSSQEDSMPRIMSAIDDKDRQLFREIPQVVLQFFLRADMGHAAGIPAVLPPSGYGP